MRTFGIEEEFFLIHPETALPAIPWRHVYNALMAVAGGGSRMHPEFMACQVESNTPICTRREEAIEAVSTTRRELSKVAREAGLYLIGLGSPPQIPLGPGAIHASERYQAINEFCGGITAEHYLSGVHVHVGIEDLPSGVEALNSLRPWLPLLTALGANSPFWRGADSSFSSWRSIQYRRWSIQGIPPFFTDAQDYLRRMEFMLGSDVVLDAGHICWGARLSTRYPTLEIRVADAQVGTSNTVLLALVMRALVSAGIHSPRPVPNPPPEAVDMAQWQAAKFGIRGNHYDLLTGSKCSMDRSLDALLRYIGTELEATGDTEYVGTGLARIMREGNGAVAQRRSFRAGGFEAVLAEADARLLD
ncbi:YbdK family carboxylate-amine ligase [Paeniglutamicibacter sp. ABSL32-1]|uniref:carboxylate-amine ligase n=1 Tax=Paeniglutamicibacter quisquiliarum TaxID=2849498 RepID=UPI001C2CEBD6|nr:YbdK family carboxylate-amine ligase [Paeniglutamicibacter quisquiliarum]